MKLTARSTQEPSYRSNDCSTEVGPLRWKVVSVPDVAEDVLHRSGIKRGMLALDLGCGVGDASLRIAKLVGPTGLVIGVDASAEAIDLAQKRATVAGQCYWTRFVTADPNTFVPHERFDVVVVRHALLLQHERATLLRLSASIHPDGAIIIVTGKPAGGADSNSSSEKAHLGHELRDRRAPTQLLKVWSNMASTLASLVNKVRGAVDVRRFDWR